MGTLGEDRVRVGFNPGSDDTVSEIKRESARLIDLCEVLWSRAAARQDGDEAARLARLAQDYYEMAAMWAVKAATE